MRLLSSSKDQSTLIHNNQLHVWLFVEMDDAAHYKTHVYKREPGFLVMI